MSEPVSHAHAPGVCPEQFTKENPAPYGDTPMNQAEAKDCQKSEDYPFKFMTPKIIASYSNGVKARFRSEHHPRDSDSEACDPVFPMGRCTVHSGVPVLKVKFSEVDTEDHADNDGSGDEPASELRATVASARTSYAEGTEDSTEGDVTDLCDITVDDIAGPGDTVTGAATDTEDAGIGADFELTFAETVTTARCGTDSLVGTAANRNGAGPTNSNDASPINSNGTGTHTDDTTNSRDTNTPTNSNDTNTPTANTTNSNDTNTPTNSNDTNTPTADTTNSNDTNTPTNSNDASTPTADTTNSRDTNTPTNSNDASTPTSDTTNSNAADTPAADVLDISAGTEKSGGNANAALNYGRAIRLSKTKKKSKFTHTNYKFYCRTANDRSFYSGFQPAAVDSRSGFQAARKDGAEGLDSRNEYLSRNQADAKEKQNPGQYRRTKDAKTKDQQNCPHKQSSPKSPNLGKYSDPRKPPTQCVGLGMLFPFWIGALYSAVVAVNAAIQPAADAKLQKNTEQTARKPRPPGMAQVQNNNFWAGADSGNGNEMSFVGLGSPVRSSDLPDPNCRRKMTPSVSPHRGRSVVRATPRNERLDSPGFFSACSVSSTSSFATVPDCSESGPLEQRGRSLSAGRGMARATPENKCRERIPSPTSAKRSPSGGLLADNLRPPFRQGFATLRKRIGQNGLNNKNRVTTTHEVCDLLQRCVNDGVLDETTNEIAVAVLDYHKTDGGKGLLARYMALTMACLEQKEVTEGLQQRGSDKARDLQNWMRLDTTQHNVHAYAKKRSDTFRSLEPRAALHNAFPILFDYLERVYTGKDSENLCKVFMNPAKPGTARAINGPISMAKFLADPEQIIRMDWLPEEGGELARPQRPQRVLESLLQCSNVKIHASFYATRSGLLKISVTQMFHKTGPVSGDQYLGYLLAPLLGNGCVPLIEEDGSIGESCVDISAVEIIQVDVANRISCACMEVIQVLRASRGLPEDEPRVVVPHSTDGSANGASGAASDPTDAEVQLAEAMPNIWSSKNIALQLVQLVWQRQARLTLVRSDISAYDTEDDGIKLITSKFRLDKVELGTA